MKPSALYLLQEPACLKPHSGAFQHISVGHKELSKSFYLKVYLVIQRIDVESKKKGIKSLSMLINFLLLICKIYSNGDFFLGLDQKGNKEFSLSFSNKKSTL
jgi:hypothetical protein